MFFKRINYLILAATLIFSGACNDESDSVLPGAPVWVQDYPKVAQGAVTADLIVEVDKPSKIYWIVANTAMSLTSEQVIAKAKAAAGSGVIFNGIVEAGEKQEKLIDVIGLAENVKYFAYFVAENAGDATALSPVKSLEFTTYYRQAKKTYYSNAEKRDVLYLIYRSEEVLKHPENQYPICFFMAGNGEVATQGEINLLRSGTLTEYISKGNDVPMMVMSLQHIITSWNTTLIDEGVEHAFKTYPVDKKKVYMSGLSGGGFACWGYASAFPSKLTAIVPISGGGNTSKGCNLKDLAIWAFHNKVDNIVSANGSINMIDKIKTCPPTQEVKLTIFPDEGHDCWRRVYDKNHPDWSVPGKAGIDKVDIYTWMLSKSK